MTLYKYVEEHIARLNTPHDIEDYQTKTLSELKLIDRDMYKLAIEAKIFRIALEVAGRYGVEIYESVKFSPKKQPRVDFNDTETSLMITNRYNDEGHGCVDIFYNMQHVAHDTDAAREVAEGFVVPGEWVTRLLALYEPIIEDEERLLDEERVHLLARMTLRSDTNDSAC